MAAPLTHRPLLGIALISVGVLGFASSEATMKYLTEDYSVTFINFVRYAIHVLILLLLVAPRVGSTLWRTERTGLVILRGAVLSVGSLFMGLALARMPVAETAAIFYLAPFMVLMLSARFLGERVNRASWLAAVLGFAGVLLILRPGSGLDPLGVVFALLNAGVIAIYTLMSRQLSHSESALAMLFYTALAGAVAFSVATLATGTGPLPDAAGMAVLGLFAMLSLLGHYCLTLAFRFAPPGVLSPITFVHLVWSVVLGWLIFGHLPDWLGLVGIAIIMVAGVALTISTQMRWRRARLATAAQID